MASITIGGQAVIEGVMMRSTDKYAISVRRPDKGISTKIFPIKETKFSNIPILRGVLRFIETLDMGIRSLSYSAAEASAQEDKISNVEIGGTIAISLIMAIGLFYVVVPLFIARFVTASNGIIFSLIEGFIRLAIFLGYLLAISMMPDIKRMFQYHGAEHMAVHCYEKGEKLTTKNVRKNTTLHPRCGTSFLLIVLLMSIFIFSVLPSNSLLERLGYRLLMLPVIAGLSYELLRLSGKHQNNAIFRAMSWPGMLLQNITTGKPDDSMIEVAVSALKAAAS